MAVIAELKRRSPSRGELRTSLGAAEQARRFAKAGASAISILTEPIRFGGSLADLRDAAAATPVPLLRKDFHIVPAQVAEAAANGASAVLLIARALPPEQLSSMMQAARDAEVEPVVEVRTEAELETALGLGARVIGVNSRDLETLEVDHAVPARLIPGIPGGVIAVWESGVSSRADVERIAGSGADAVLVGSALSLADDAEQLVRSLTGVAREQRRG